MLFRSVDLVGPERTSSGRLAARFIPVVVVSTRFGGTYTQTRPRFEDTLGAHSRPIPSSRDVQELGNSLRREAGGGGPEAEG